MAWYDTIAPLGKIKNPYETAQGQPVGALDGAIKGVGDAAATMQKQFQYADQKQRDNDMFAWAKQNAYDTRMMEEAKEANKNAEAERLFGWTKEQANKPQPRVRVNKNGVEYTDYGHYVNNGINWDWITDSSVVSGRPEKKTSSLAPWESKPFVGQDGKAYIQIGSFDGTTGKYIVESTQEVPQSGAPKINPYTSPATYDPKTGGYYVEEGYYPEGANTPVITGRRTTKPADVNTGDADNAKRTRTAQEMYSRVLDLEKAFNPKYVGAIDGRLPDIFLGKTEQAFRQANARLLSETVQMISGAAASDKERDFIESWVPSVTKNEAGYKAAIDEIKRYLEVKMKSPEQMNTYIDSRVRANTDAQHNFNTFMQD